MSFIISFLFESKEQVLAICKRMVLNALKRVTEVLCVEDRSTGVCTSPVGLGGAIKGTGGPGPRRR